VFGWTPDRSKPHSLRRVIKVGWLTVKVLYRMSVRVRVDPFLTIKNKEGPLELGK
jgi:hypothetical protein